jgi:metal-responsive CopG/Arc/MetJ family transcriptional regulator
VTISLSEEMLAAADRAGVREHRTRSELMREALRWYLRAGTLAVEEPTDAERAAIATGRAEHARGESLSPVELRHDLEARLREAGRQEPAGPASR